MSSITFNSSSGTVSPAYEFGNMMIQLAQNMNQQFDKLPLLRHPGQQIEQQQIEFTHYIPLVTYPSKQQLLELAIECFMTKDLKNLIQLFSVTSFNPNIIRKDDLKFTLKFFITQYTTHFLQSKQTFSELLNIINVSTNAIQSQIELDFIFQLPKLVIPTQDVEYYLIYIQISQMTNNLIFNSVSQQIILQLEKISTLKNNLNLLGIYYICRLSGDDDIRSEAEAFYINQKDIQIVDLRVQGLLSVCLLI
ncbi:hypothetical protein SS50377_22672 [Spironucleus salmonicida]|uniref:Uncharacterized protein n=1 Tax=Spironucleus salmonicida TaxID=348837 RepID=V6LWI1_9EUKA|nr:hypothetical protein SS50377_22672 [Spironucleus salmonicida]|eukprot:EST48992.1 Hypothetical protein SS50377_10762 [Spironucleus salmonicida]